MADQRVVLHMGENSPEQIAYKLLLDVARAEGKLDSVRTIHHADRKWILETYAECLSAAQGKKSVFDLKNI